ncbi:hypothetical protein Thiosp_03251 [Thiorhodovibrio litoralis]|uniref:hypothetical protein n=1 Tax=Thiorhodovibrio winogradskyi TaxID=77007 RepID=UPI0019126E19|nr:hypothetical protein [Thiorhodovibrio winogradskyi]MBK5968500.1 hypothetical protein [Thiorhodovibrio winogradskyi]WPL13450.1 hypothetical protein Thiosp_03251 [Thiorhodovibrio litoralis]
MIKTMARPLWHYMVWYRSGATVRPDNHFLPLPVTFYAAAHSAPWPFCREQGASLAVTHGVGQKNQSSVR